MNKYAEKFNINREPPKLTLAPRELNTKIKWIKILFFHCHCKVQNTIFNFF